MIALLNGDARTIPLADRSVHCCVTSPPFWGLRDYGLEPMVWGGEVDCGHEWVKAPPPSVPRRGNKSGDYSTSSLTNPERQDQVSRGTQSGQWCRHCDAWCGNLGLEPMPDLYVEHIVACMREVWRVLRDDGTLWLNLGDSYFGNGGQYGDTKSTLQGRKQSGTQGAKRFEKRGPKPKDLCMIPARVALALQADGWYLRSDIIWAKPNPMPESVTDRPTKAHEYIFLLSKAEQYYYDAEAIKEPAKEWTGQAATFERENGKATELRIPGQVYASHRSNRKGGGNFSRRYAGQQPEHGGMQLERGDYSNGRNKRSVWTVATKPYSGAHFAVFPEDLVEPMILAGTSARGCCPKCGAPWVRMTERNTRFGGGSGKAGRTAEEVNKRGKWADKQYGKNIKLGPVVESRTAGWRPSCNCNAGDPIPCIVLDPFSGTATVGRACARHGRRFVGVELSRDYIALARERTSNVQMELGA